MVRINGGTGHHLSLPENLSTLLRLSSISGRLRFMTAPPPTASERGARFADIATLAWALLVVTAFAWTHFDASRRVLRALFE